jgi:signal transduction histidine kinase
MASADRQYVETTRRLNSILFMGSGVISVLVVASAWRDPQALASIAAILSLRLAFNVAVTTRLLPRYGVRAEILRGLVNAPLCLLAGHLAHWSVAVWLWLPFNALAYDFDRRVSWGLLLAHMVPMDVLGILDGARLADAVCFTAGAFFCARILSVRHSVVRNMVLESDAQLSMIACANHDLTQAHQCLMEETRARERVEIELRQAQKLEAIGRLASGIAHEINTPVQFVGDSVRFMREAMDDLLKLIEAYRCVPGSTEIRELEEELDLDYLIDELPSACERSDEGLARIADIVRAMKAFAHPDQKAMTPVDINLAIESTLVIARSEYKHVAIVELDLGELPFVVCHGGEINQVILNLVVNAAHAIADGIEASDAKGRIEILTRNEGEHVRVVISDSGVGIPDDVKQHIFEPFFTTKEVGRGTGQGLTFSLSVVQNHGGTLTFDSVVGRGTTFSMRLPIAPGSAPLGAAAA